MVVAVFPLAKIGLLLLKQLSKPVANFIKNEAKKHPQMRKYVIAPIGRAYSQIENKARGSLRGINTTQPVTEEEAVELGANAVGEIILFGLLCLILLAEITRQGTQKAEKEKTKAEEILHLHDMVLELNDEVNDIKKSIEKIEKKLETEPDIFDMEHMKYQQINDHNFWDAFIKKKPVDIDPGSPSI